MMEKDYLLSMIVLGSDFREQEAIEWAILHQGWFKPTSITSAQDKLAIERELPALWRNLQQEARENDRHQEWSDAGS